ncbi:MAG: cell division protein FtsZ [Candidatus Diapherotrites archaeon]|nr:cell division protein FtsZ [Candidatus Diapherotrites archaeon]
MDKIVKDAVRRTRSNLKSNKETKKRSIKKMNNLDEILTECTAKIKVIGTGGSGNNTLQRMMEIGITGAQTIAMNTDVQQLTHTESDDKLLIGKETTQGLGAGSDPDVGEAAAKESMEEIGEKLADADLVFVTCGLGGGTGTGSAPVIAEIAKSKGALTIAVVTLPFTVEGKKRMENALDGLNKLKKAADTVVVIPNDKLLEVAPDLPIKGAFKVADEVLTNAVKGITELITLPGLVNLDFADLRTVLQKCGAAMIGLGESSRDSSLDSRALDAVENALTSPLLDIDISEASKALVNVTGGNDMTLKEAEMIMEAVAAKIHPNAHIIWGARIDDDLGKAQIQAMVIIAGGKIPYLEAVKEEVMRDGKRTVDLGLDYIE